ncbi:ABC-type antimicrobial peptide transport system permease subunit [Saonia flava]|uniref:ABC-type antimicrobial peptide transport system permease subunit n=1 Tax=Saonia flava TaxID=523696 RepID=A0A846QSN8_9FLAO|nr:ABC transporter permease [Saonia flava]NJB70227.1 ABC-type antimicrobial peptide transport system permease subunit [Saonia flava]
MVKNYLKIACRGLLKRKGYSALNIGGLALGMTTTMLIGIWSYNELSYNKEFENYASIVQVMQSQTFGEEINTGTNQPLHLAPVLRNEYGDYFKHIVTSNFGGNQLLSVGEHKVSRTGNFMEPGITDMLSLKMLKGTRSALEDPTSLLISESTAKVLFGDVDPMGKTVKIGTSMQTQVAGIYKDLPQNSDFKNLSFIAPWELLNKTANFEERLGWGNNWFQVYAQLEDGANLNMVSTLIKDVKYNNIKNGESGSLKTKPVIHLHPMNKWHLYSRFENGINTGGAIDRVWLFGIIGIFILLLACINFMNLSTAKSVKRAKEVGIRKTIGSVKSQLMTQFLSESLLVVFIAFIVSCILVLLAQPFFNDLTGKTMNIPWESPFFWVFALLFILFTGIISGSYPAFYLSSFKPIKVLKGKLDGGLGASRFRKVLVVFQFTISVMLIFGTLTIFKQLEHVKNRSIGYDRDQLLYVPINTPEIVTHFDAVRNEILSSSDIKEVAASDVLNTGAYTTNGGFDWKGKDPNMSEEFNTLRATYGYGDMVNWEIKEGRDFSREFKSDSTAFIVNETAVRYMGLENPVGEMVKWGDNGSFKIVGVVKDMVTQSPFDQVKPMLFILHYGRFLNYINIKINKEGDTKSALAHIEKVFKKHDPESLFFYSFLDEEYAKNFVNEERTGRLASFFAFLAIFISCLGIFGLSAFVAEQRTKEIGVRKVLGASVYNLWQLLSREFVLMVLLSCCIAVPIGNYYMNGWMEKYAYRTDISWGVFVVTILGAMVITLLTVSFQSIKAAIVNPVKSLQTE